MNTTVLRFHRFGRRSLVAAAAAVTTVAAFGHPTSAAGPVESNPVVDGARQGLAGFLAAYAPTDAGDLDLGTCPILGADAFASPLAFFGPAEAFDTYTGELSTDEGSDSAGLVGVSCEAERAIAPRGGVLSGGVGAWDFAGATETLAFLTDLPVTSDDLAGRDLLDGDMHGYCDDSSDAYECYQFWTSDGFVVGMFVGFESEDSQKDPLRSVGELLAGQLPGLLANVSGLTPVPGLSTPEATVATTSTIPIGGK